MRSVHEVICDLAIEQDSDRISELARELHAALMAEETEEGNRVVSRFRCKKPSNNCYSSNT